MSILMRVVSRRDRLTPRGRRWCSVDSWASSVKTRRDVLTWKLHYSCNATTDSVLRQDTCTPYHCIRHMVTTTIKPRYTQAGQWSVPEWSTDKQLNWRWQPNTDRQTNADSWKTSRNWSQLAPSIINDMIHHSSSSSSRAITERQ